MYESLRKLLGRIEDSYPPSPVPLNITDEERNDWRAFGSQLRRLMSDEQLIEKLTDKPDKLRSFLQQKLARAARDLEAGRKSQSEGRSRFALAVFRDGLRNMLDGIGVDHQLTFQLLAETCGVIQEQESEASAIAAFSQHFSNVPKDVRPTLTAHYLWYAETRMAKGRMEAAFEGFRTALVEATSQRLNAEAKEASLGVAVICRDTGDLPNAVAVFEELLSDTSPETDPVPRYTLLHELAAVTIRLNDVEKARELLAEAQMRCRGELPESRRIYVRILQTMIYAETVAGNTDLVNSLMDEIKLHVKPDDPAWVTITLQDVERMVQSEQTLADALSLMNDVQNQAARTLPYESSEYATLMETWGHLAARFDRPRTVRWALREALKLRKRVSGVEAPETAQLMLEWVNLQLQAGEIQQALNLAAGARQVFLDTTGQQSIFFARAANAFARCCLEIGALDEAKAAFEEAGQSYEYAVGANAREAHINRSGLGSVLFKQKQFPEAETIFAETSNALHKIKHPSGFDRQLTAITVNLSGTLVARSKYTEADDIIQSLLDELGETTDETMLRAALLNQRFCMQYEQDEFAKALMTVRNAFSLILFQHPNQARILFNQSVCEAALGRTADAIRTAEASLAIFEATLGQGHPDYAHVVAGLEELREAMAQGKSIHLLPLFTLAAA